jgi:hypothetical protein
MDIQAIAFMAGGKPCIVFAVGASNLMGELSVFALA